MGIPAGAGVGASGAPPAGDQANFVVSGNLAVVGQSAPFAIYGAFNLAIWAGAPPATNGVWGGSIQLEKSFDGGTTWMVVGIGGAGQGAIYVGATQNGVPVCISGSEPEKGVLYRVNLTSLTAGGPVYYRISGNGLAAMVWGVPGG